MNRQADVSGLGERIREYRAGMKPHITAILQGPHAMNGGSPDDIAEHIMDALSRAGFVCAGPTVERITAERDAEREYLNDICDAYEDWKKEYDPDTNDGICASLQEAIETAIAAKQEP